MSEEVNAQLTLPPPPPPRRRGRIVRRTGALLASRIGPLLRWLGPVTLLAALPGAVVQAVMLRNMGLTWYEGQRGMPLELMTPAWFAAQIGTGLLASAVLLPLVLAVAYLVLRGASPSPLRDAARSWPRAVGATLLWLGASALPVVPGALLIGITLAVVGVDLGTGPVTPGAADALVGLGFFSMLAGTFLMLFLGLSFALAVPAAVLDGHRPVASLRESWRRIQRQRLRLLGGQAVWGLPGAALGFALVPVAAMLPGRLLPGLLTGALSSLWTVAVLAAVSFVIYRDTDPVPPAIGEPGEPGEPGGIEVPGGIVEHSGTTEPSGIAEPVRIAEPEAES